MTTAALQSKPHTKLKTAALIFGVLVLATCVMIFLFSAQDATRSTLTSGRVTGLIRRIFFPDFDTYPPERQYALMERISLIVRKGAHFTEYLLLASFTFHLLIALPRPRSEVVCGICAQLFSTFYAITDEYHQSFVPGRAMMLRDVLIDSSGALLGILVGLTLRYLIKKRRERGTD